MTTVQVLRLYLFCMLVLIIWPLLIVWSVNALFGLGIEYTIKTWFAAFVLLCPVAWGHREHK